MVDDLVKGRGFGGASPVVLELRLCLFPHVAPEHAGLFAEVRLIGVLELGRIADRDSGKASGSAMRLRSSRLYVRVATSDLQGDGRFTPG